MSTTPPRICIGVIVGAHGIKGGVRVKCFTDQPKAIGKYGPVQDESGQRRWKVRVQGESKGLALLALDGVGDRNMAETLKGVKLYVDRTQLPQGDEDEFLVADLVGCRAVAPDGKPLGQISEVFDFGAGEVLEVKGPGGTFMVPFAHQFVPHVDVEARQVVIEPPVYAPDEEGEEQGTKFEADEP